MRTTLHPSQAAPLTILTQPLLSGRPSPPPPIPVNKKPPLQHPVSSPLPDHSKPALQREGRRIKPGQSLSLRSSPDALSLPGLHHLPLLLPFWRSDQGPGDLLYSCGSSGRPACLIHQVSSWDPGNPAPCANTGGGPSQAPGSLGCGSEVREGPSSPPDSSFRGGSSHHLFPRTLSPTVSQPISISWSKPRQPSLTWRSLRGARVL